MKLSEMLKSVRCRVRACPMKLVHDGLVTWDAKKNTPEEGREERTVLSGKVYQCACGMREHFTPDKFPEL